MDAVACAIVFGIGAAKPLLGIPVGFILGLDPLSVFVAVSAGALACAGAIIILGEKVRSFVLGRWGNCAPGWRHTKARQLWENYGIKGMGLLGPLFPGAPLAAAIGVALGAPRLTLMTWLAAGVVFWTAALVALIHLGIVGVSALI